MCDTFVVLPEYTKSGSNIFGKNSDREPNEAQVIEYYPKSQNNTDSAKCTHIAIPPVSETFAVLLSRPFWMFGAEMGVNEFGVSIGNEAVFTRMKHKEKGLLGMDLLRLALERSKDAKGALLTITSLLNEYGQGGTNSFFRNYFYDNSFLISDRETAWVLETAGEFWVAKQVRDHYSISNILTIHTDYDLASPGLEIQANARGYWGSSQLDFAKAFQDRLYSILGKGRERLDYTRTILSGSSEKFDLGLAKSLLRIHEREGERKGNTGDICMHAGGFFSPDQTTSSMITTFQDGTLVTYATGSSLPCESVFKPHVVRGDEFVQYTSAGSMYDPRSFWWSLEKLHRTATTQGLREIQWRLEGEFEQEFDKLIENKATTKELVEFSKSCYSKELAQIAALPLPQIKLRRYWRNMNKKALIANL